MTTSPTYDTGSVEIWIWSRMQDVHSRNVCIRCKQRIVTSRGTFGNNAT